MTHIASAAPKHAQISVVVTDVMAPHPDEVTDVGDSRAASAASVFRKDFDGYQKMLAADYLEHTLLFGAVKSYLQGRRKPLRILDLGCGDAKNLFKHLAETRGVVASYTGVDMSESAVQQAHEAVESALGSATPVFFHLSDMLSFLKQTKAEYDVVIAAFSLHHLTTEDKAETLKEIHRLVHPVGGDFVMADPFRQEGESLEAYRQRATQVGQTWVLMGEEQQKTFIKHMQDYDIVEPKGFFEEAGKAAGFRKVEWIRDAALGPWGFE